MVVLKYAPKSQLVESREISFPLKRVLLYDFLLSPHVFLLAPHCSCQLMALHTVSEDRWEALSPLLTLLLCLRSSSFSFVSRETSLCQYPQGTDGIPTHMFRSGLAADSLDPEPLVSRSTPSVQQHTDTLLFLAS